MKRGNSFIYVNKYTWDDPLFFRACDHHIIWCSMQEGEVYEILKGCHTLPQVNIIGESLYPPKCYNVSIILPLCF